MTSQGFGNVGTHTAAYLAERGAVLVGASDLDGTVYDENGIDVKKLTSWKNSELRSAAKPLPWILRSAFSADTTRSASHSVRGPRRWGITSLDLYSR